MRSVSQFIVGLFGWLLIVASAHGAAAEAWVKVRTPHFVVLTQASEAKARQWATELEQFHAGLQQILPVPEDRLTPVTVVLFRTDKALSPFKPLERGKPQNIAGFFSKIQDSHAIALALDYDPNEVRRIIYHEAVHWHTSAADRPLPPWLEEGLAEVYSTFRANGKGSYSFGQLIPEHVDFLRRVKPLPLEKLTATPRGSVAYNEGNRATMFYAESWAFVHYLLFGEGNPGMKSVSRYITFAETAASPKAAFEAAFGDSSAEFDRKLSAYLRNGKYHTYTYKNKPVNAVAVPIAAPASAGEVEMALAVLLLGSKGEQNVEAMQRLQRAARLMPKNPDVWKTMGEAALFSNDYSAAQEYFARAGSLGSTSYFTYYGLGIARMHGRYGALSVEDRDEATRAAENFRKSIELNPRYTPAYESLAGIVPALEKPSPKDRAYLERGRVYLPESVIIDVGLSVCDFSIGRRAVARQRLELALATTKSGQRDARDLARTLLKDDDWNQFVGRIDGLFKQKKYTEVITAIDAARGDFTGTRYVQALTINRQMAENYRKIAEAVKLANNGETKEALAILEVVSISKDVSTRAEAKRLITEIGKMGKSR